MALSFLGPQSTIPTTEIPLGGPGAHQNSTKWGAKQRLRGVKQPQTPKQP